MVMGLFRRKKKDNSIENAAQESTTRAAQTNESKSVAEPDKKPVQSKPAAEPDKKTAQSKPVVQAPQQVEWQLMAATVLHGLLTGVPDV